MIVKDEEGVLARCLESVAGLFDEVIVVDTGSCDKTPEIALAFGASVFPFAWREDFALARNFSFSLASSDYLFWLDADDVLPPSSASLFPALKKFLAREEPDVVFCPYDVSPRGQEGACVFGRERVLKRSAKPVWRGRVHECVAPFGKVASFPLGVRHLGSEKARGTRNLDIYRKAVALGEALSRRDIFYYGRELYYNGFYGEAIEVLSPLLSAQEAWVVNVIESCKILALCHEALGNLEKAKEALLYSLSLAEPRAGVLCELARIFSLQNRRREEIFWLNSALRCRDHSSEGDFDFEADRFFRPLLALVCAYYAVGEREQALLCHRLLRERFPDHSAVRFNEEFFRKAGLISS